MLARAYVDALVQLSLQDYVDTSHYIFMLDLINRLAVYR